MKINILIGTLFFVSCLTTINACKKESMQVTGNNTYFPRVKLIIQSRCLSCHGSTGTWAGRPTTFDTDSQIVAASGSIKASVADPATMFNKRMPQDGTLSQSDIDVIVKWYNKGGKVTD